MSFKDDLIEGARKLLLQAFNETAATLDEVEEYAKGWSLEEWRIYRMAQAGSLALPNLVPGAGLIVLLPELLILIRFMRIAALGVGFIKNGSATATDFENILAFSSASHQQQKIITAKLRASAAATVAGGAVAVLTPAMAAGLMSGAIVDVVAAGAGHIAPIAAQKGAAWLAKLLGGPALASWIPFIGFVISAGANVYITGAVLEAAETYFDEIKSVSK
jgi:hypothetical protein